MIKFVTVQRSEVNQGVIPAQAGIQRGYDRMDARFHGHDKNGRRELPEAELLLKFRGHRFKPQIAQIVVLSILYFLFFTLSYAQPLSSTELINNAKTYDGKIVVYEGEVIGDVMRRADYVWINLHDGKNALGIWLHKDLAKGILFTGSYKTKGDWLEVQGSLQRACKQHGGDLDIHAQTIKKIRSGRLLQINLNLAKRNLAIFLLGVLCLILFCQSIKA
ncbi:MAG: hypothetical protein QMD94_02070 [Candidatus Omnitrophota bacterium]|nr:hypothetical protein [Candidatus Omnitrophota bacterium]